MKFIIDVTDKSVRDVMDIIGYQSARFTKKGQFSMIKPLDRNNIYPRFHLIGERLNSHTVFNLHLDETNIWHRDNTDHTRDYNSEKVKNEVERIKKLL